MGPYLASIVNLLFTIYNLIFIASYLSRMSSSTILVNDNKTIRAWAFFDWANSAYSLVISTAVFPIYFLAVAPDSINLLGNTYTDSSIYSFVVSFSYLLVAILSPILSGIADYGGKRMWFLKLFTTMGAVGCAVLYFFESDQYLWLGVTAFGLGTIGYAGSLVFYNSYLPQIASEDQYDSVSAKGYSYGYVGSVLLLIVILAMVQKPDWFGITAEGQGARIGFLLVGIWWIVFAQITFRKMPKDSVGKLESGIIGKGFRELRGTFKLVVKDKNIRRFLLSFLFFSAGVNTVIYVATIFAEQEIGFKTAELILLVLILQLVAVVGALFFAFVSNRLGNKMALLIQIAIWMLICVIAFFTQGKTVFYVLVGVVGLVLGGIQSLSRSSYTKLLDDDIDDLSSYYSFYDVLFKVSIVGGTFLFGFIEYVTKDIRYSVLSLGVLFLIGMLVLMGVNFGKDKKLIGSNV